MENDAAIREEVRRIVASQPFSRSERIARFLTFTVEEALNGREGELKEYRIGTEVFDRGAAFDPRTDTIVRSQAHRLRTMLAAYYASEGREDPLVIEYPKGSYAPVFAARKSDEPPTPVLPPPPPDQRSRMAIAAVIAVSALIAGALGYWLHKSPEPISRLELALVLPTDLRLDRGFGALSPNAESFVFPGTDRSGATRLWLRAMAGPSVQPFAGSEDAALPGRQIQLALILIPWSDPF